jgi:uncharacterized protein YecT (DUF1311 family)
MNKHLIFSRILKTFTLIYVILLSYGHASQAGMAYNEADQALNETYQKVLTLITNSEEKKLFIQAQRDWLRFKDAEVAFHAKYYPTSKGGLFVDIDMIEKRTNELKVLLTKESMEEHDESFSN